MSSFSSGSKILVTGANGFIAVWVVKKLLERGYSVRGTVRAENKAVYIHNLFSKYGDKFETVVVPDITKDGAFDEAVKGVDAIEHTASPFHFDADGPDDIVVPAVRGTVGILQSALKHAGSQLKRVVVLSSGAAVSNPTDTGVIDERSWNNDNVTEIREKGRNATQLAKYRASKSLAERSAWDWVERHKSEITWDLVSLCPPFVYGPIIHEVCSPENLNVSMKDFYSNVIKKNKTPADLAAFQGNWVNVHDVTEAHIRAIEVPKAGGNRFLICGGNFIWQDWFDEVNSLSFLNIEAPKGTPSKGKDFKFKMIYDTSKAENILGIQFKDKTETAKEIVECFQEKGWC